MYVLLIGAIFGTLILILLARKYPIVSAILYISALIYFVGFAFGRVGISGMSFRFPLPFWKAIKAGHYGLTTNRSVLNMMLFIPFGYLVPQTIAVLKRVRVKWWIVVLTGFLTSLLIETSQIVFRFGVFELDDLVKNTMGAAIGYGMWELLEKRR